MLNVYAVAQWFHFRLMVCSVIALVLSICSSVAQDQPVTVTITAAQNPEVVPPQFLGLSYEMSMVLPRDGKYYFDANNPAVVQTFRTLGIRSLRVGANAVDDPRIPIPQEKDIDSLFAFARAAGVKVIYSFRLKDGNAAEAARLARYIEDHDADALDSFSIGNEPGYYHPYDVYYAKWKPIYDAILQAVPNATFDGPSVVGEKKFQEDNYVFNLAKAIFPSGHLAMASNHYYFLGSGREGEKDPAATRNRFLSNDVHKTYADAYKRMGAVLAAEGVPYRIDELNSCFDGGSKGSSDAYADALWALDCTHWWATHHILGMNYHTGERVGRDGGFAASNYASFVHTPDGRNFVMRPHAYAELAFSQGAKGQVMKTELQATPDLNFNAYAYRDHDGSLYVTLINKSYGGGAHVASVSLHLPSGSATGTWQRMDLAQKQADVAASGEITLGGGGIDSQGRWSGGWKSVSMSGDPHVEVPAASAVLLRIPIEATASR
jgi:hypothetical protein